MSARSNADKAESLMISGLFKGAAREAQRVLEDADPSQADKLRAAYTLLQSLFELNRLSDVRSVLVGAYAGSCVPLRASLVLEEGSPDAAVDVLRHSLEATITEAAPDSPAPDGGELSAHDVAKGARLYVCDMLASSPGGARAAVEWLERFYGTADQRDEAVMRQRAGTPLTAWQAFIADTATRQALYKELDERHPTAGRMTSPSVTADTITRASGPQQRQGSASNDAELPTAPRLGDATVASRDRPASATSAAAPDASADGGAERRSPLCWWEQPMADQGKGVSLNLSSGELTVLAIGGAIFLYAAVSERKSISRGLSRSLEVVGASINELFRLATTLRPNPMSAASPAIGQRY